MNLQIPSTKFQISTNTNDPMTKTKEKMKWP